jgi:hypothetical protein
VSPELLKRTGIGAAALLLAALVGSLIVRSRSVEDPSLDGRQGTAASSSAGNPAAFKSHFSAGYAEKPVSSSPATPSKTGSSPEALKGQDAVMCRSHLQNWISSIESGNQRGAENSRKALTAHGALGKSTVAWGLESLNLKESTREVLRSAYAEFP